MYCYNYVIHNELDFFMVKIFTTKYQFLGRILLTLLLAVVSCVNAWAADHEYKTNVSIGVGEVVEYDNVVINPGVTVTVKGTMKVTGNLVNNGGTLNVDGGSVMVEGNVTNNPFVNGETSGEWEDDGRSSSQGYTDGTYSIKQNSGYSYRITSQKQKKSTQQNVVDGNIAVSNGGSLSVAGDFENYANTSIATTNQTAISRISVGKDLKNAKKDVSVQKYKYTRTKKQREYYKSSNPNKGWNNNGNAEYDNESGVRSNDGTKTVPKSGTITLDNGYLVVNGDATLENGSQVNYKQTYKNLKGVVGEEEVDIKSTVIVKGNLTQNENAKISNENSSKADLIIGGMYYDLAPKENHPWSIEYQTEKFIVKWVTGAEFEMSDDNFTLNVGGGYSVTTESVSSDGFISAIFKIIFGGTVISPDAKDKIEEYLKDLASNGIGAADVSNIIEKVSTLLPITLNYFTAVQDGEDVVFDWQTASEVNNDFFTIEYSIDGIHFKELLREDGNGTTSVTNDYYATASAEEFAGITYFRLKQTDFNGEYSYSDVIFVSIVSEETELYVFPNPTTDYVSVSGNVASAYVSDMYGRNLSCLQTSENTFAVAGLSVGTYYVVVSTKNGKKVLPFVKK